MLLPRHLAQHLEDSHRLLVLGHRRLYCSLLPWRSRPSFLVRQEAVGAQKGCISDFSQQIHSPFWRRSATDSGVANDQTQSGVLMGERFRVGFIALTVVVVGLAIVSAIFSAVRPKPPQNQALYTPPATLSPSPSPSPWPTLTPQPPTPAPVATVTPLATNTLRPSPTFTPYVVQPGETLSTIAKSYGVTRQAILAANPDITDPGRVKAGQVVLIPPPGWAPSPSPIPAPASFPG
jgi:LysM repeat protein